MSNIRPWWVISDPNFKGPVETPTGDESVPAWAQALHERLSAVEMKLEDFMHKHAPAEQPHEPLTDAGG